MSQPNFYSRPPQSRPPADRRLPQPGSPQSRRGDSAPSLRPPRSPQPPPDPVDGDEAEVPRSIFGRWQLWAIVGVTISTSIAGVSAALLLRLPGLPNCPELFLPTASASLRLYCAQAAADKRTITDLLAAIALIDDLPADHPMRAEVDQQIELWAADILDLADEKFQAGELGEAIAAARQIPSQTGAAQLVTERIQQWESTWAEAEKIYDDALVALRRQDFRNAFVLASQLLDIPNQYWSTIQYQQLTDQVFIARRQAEQLTEARDKADQGGVANLLAAIQLAKEIPSTSYAYDGAQQAIRDFIDELFDLAVAELDDDPQAGIAIARQIPSEPGVADRVQDFIVLAQAAVIAETDNAIEMEQAIQQAQQLGSDSSFYATAQQYIGRWQLEIQDVAQIALAKRLAAPGGVANLQAAIVEAERVPRRNPRGDEAAELVQDWRTQVETIQDRPILTQAQQLAVPGGVMAWQRAIALAQRIEPGRSLYDEAQDNIATWRRQLETTQDQPILAEARALATRGDVRTAITMARRITAGRALHSEAQTEIERWQAQIDGEQALQAAYQAATLGTPDQLARAIARADDVPSRSASRAEADRMRNLWSQELLDMAANVAAFDLERAIAIAGDIPANTSAYTAAQQRIAEWDAQLIPPPAEVEPPAAIELP